MLERLKMADSINLQHMFSATSFFRIQSMDLCKMLGSSERENGSFFGINWVNGKERLCPQYVVIVHKEFYKVQRKVSTNKYHFTRPTANFQSLPNHCRIWCLKVQSGWIHGYQIQYYGCAAQHECIGWTHLWCQNLMLDVNFWQWASNLTSEVIFGAQRDKYATLQLFIGH